MAFHQTDKHRNVYYEFHRGPKLPIVLSHGWAMSSRVWVDVIEALRAAGHAVLAIDHRGCGQSDRDYEDLSVGAIADDIVAVVDACGLPRVAVNGWSLGGAIAAEAAHRLGSRTAGLVLTNGASPRFTRCVDFPYGGERENLMAMPATIAVNRAGFFHGLAQSVCAVDVGQAAIDWMWSIFMNSGPGAIQSLMDIADLDQRALLASLECPVLSIVGGKDVILQPEVGMEAAKCARHGELVVFEACGHAPFIEDLPLYRETLLAFLARL